MENIKEDYVIKIIALLMKLDEKSCRRIYLMVAGMIRRGDPDGYM